MGIICGSFKCGYKCQIRCSILYCHLVVSISLSVILCLCKCILIWEKSYNTGLIFVPNSFTHLIESTLRVDRTVSAWVRPSSSESSNAFSFCALNLARDFTVSLLSFPRVSLGMPVLVSMEIFFGFWKGYTLLF